MTTSRSISWIDRSRWDTLLAAATKRAPVGSGFSPAVASVRAARPAAPAPAPAPAPAAAVAAPARPAKPTYPPFRAESQLLDERLASLVGWIERCVSCRAAFIADDNGLPVVEHLGAEQGHIAAASSILMMLASVRSLVRESGSWLALKLESSVLHVVEVETRWGRFGLGVVTDDSLPQEFLTALSAAVESAFHGDLS